MAGLYELIAALADASWETRVRAREQLVARGRESVQLLREVIQRGPESAALQAAIALGQLEDVSDPPSLLPALRAPWESVRAEAARVLGKRRAKYAVGPLADALRDPGVRASAAEALGAIGDSAVVPALLTVLRETARSVDPASFLARFRAAVAVIDLAGGEDLALEALRAVVQKRFDGHHSWPTFRVRALERLLQCDAVSDESLRGLVTNGADPVAVRAAGALADRGVADDKSTEVLRQAAKRGGASAEATLAKGWLQKAVAAAEARDKHAR